MDIREEILAFFVQKKRADGITFDVDLFKGRFVDSLFAFEIVRFLEKTFAIKIKNKEITKENFQSIDAMAALVERIQHG